MAKSNDFWSRVEIAGADKIWGEGANEKLKDKLREALTAELNRPIRKGKPGKRNRDRKVL